MFLTKFDSLSKYTVKTTISFGLNVIYDLPDLNGIVKYNNRVLFDPKLQN